MDLPAPIIGKNDYKPVLQMVVGPPLGWACIGQTAYFGAREEQREIFSYDLHFSLLRSHCACNFRCQGLMSATLQGGQLGLLHLAC